MKEKTKIVTAGRDPEANFGVVNPPVYHASTILFPTLDALENRSQAVTPYGRRGTPGTFALEEALCEIEGGDGCRLAPSGIAAVACVLSAFLKPGAHLLMVDSAYEPTRTLCDDHLKRWGVETTYYDPLLGSGIADLIRPETALVFTESPGSRTFEVQDIPAITKAAHEKNVPVAIDNTWASPLYFKPFEHGVDVSVQSATKYVCGHSDVMMGAITATKRHMPRLDETHRLLGLCAGPDDVYLAQRGLRTLAVRLEQHWRNAMKLAEWFKGRPEVHRVMYPALEDDPGHALWRRDFSGASGLFGVELTHGSRRQVAAMLDGLKLFGMGFSWGGYESLITPSRLAKFRTATPWAPKGPVLRIHAGLEDADDLIADLAAGFDRFNEAGKGASDEPPYI